MTGRHEKASMNIAIDNRGARSPPVVYRYERSARGWGVVRSNPGVACPRGNSLEGSSMLSFFLLRAHLGNDLGLVHAVVDAVLDSRSRKPGSAQRVLAMIPLGSMRLTTIIHCASLWISFHHGWPLWVWTGWLPGMSPLFKVGVLKKSPQSSCIFPNLLAPWNPGHVQVQSKTQGLGSTGSRTTSRGERKRV